VGDKKIVVASPNVYLNIHAEPSLGSEVLGKMYSNDLAIELRKEDERWTKIRSGNVVGYVMNEYLVEGNEAEALSEIVSTPLATVKEDKGTDIYQDSTDNSKIIGDAKEGDQYEVLESTDGWIGILTDNGVGYIPSSEVSLSMAYPVAESSREEVDRVNNSNVKERADHEQRKAEKADAVVELAKTRANVADSADEETATAVVEVALRAADAAAAQADVAQVAVSQAGEESGQAVIEFATQYIGNPYVWGGSSLTHGADCSGFVMAVYGNFGFRLPHYDRSDRSVGSPVASLAEARAGDIVCYNGHVALYMGDGMIVHAQDERHGITTSRADFMHIVCIRRLFN
jgi:cell wall-associated NlpC family hydrolase